MWKEGQPTLRKEKNSPDVDWLPPIYVNFSIRISLQEVGREICCKYITIGH